MPEQWLWCVYSREDLPWYTADGYLAEASMEHNQHRVTIVSWEVPYAD